MGRARTTVEQQEARIEELEEELAAAQERIRELEAALAAASAQQENAEPAQADAGSAGRLEWTGDDDDGYLARALAEDISYAVFCLKKKNVVECNLDNMIEHIRVR